MEKLFEELSQYKITLIRWRDEWGHWRLGLDWNNENDYEYIVEESTIKKCLEKAIEYHRKK